MSRGFVGKKNITGTHTNTCLNSASACAWSLRAVWTSALTDIFCFVPPPPSAFRAHTCVYVARAKVNTLRMFPVSVPEVMTSRVSLAGSDNFFLTVSAYRARPKTYTCQVILGKVLDGLKPAETKVYIPTWLLTSHTTSFLPKIPFRVIFQSPS